MPRRIDVEIGRNGQVKVEFSGFQGETCFDEDGVFQKMLKELGLWAIPVTVTPKTAIEMDDEMGVERETKKKVPLA